MTIIQHIFLRLDLRGNRRGSICPREQEKDAYLMKLFKRKRILY